MCNGGKEKDTKQSQITLNNFFHKLKDSQDTIPSKEAPVKLY